MNSVSVENGINFVPQLPSGSREKSLLFKRTSSRSGSSWQRLAGRLLVVVNGIAIIIIVVLAQSKWRQASTIASVSEDGLATDEGDVTMLVGVSSFTCKVASVSG